MGNRRTAKPEPSIPATSVESRLAGAVAPQYAQTGVGNSTGSIVYDTLTVTGTLSANNLSVTGSSFVWQTTAIQTMAFQSATGVHAIIANSSWLSGPINSTSLQSSAANLVLTGSSFQSGPVTSTAGNFTGTFQATGTITLNAWTSASAVVTGYFTVQTATGGTVKLGTITT